MQLEEIREQRNNKVARFRKQLGIIMALFYFVVAFIFAFIPLDLGITPLVRWSFVTVITLYGIFRLYRSLK